MRCRIEIGMTRNSRKRTKFYTQIQTEKRFFFFRDREGKRFSIVTGHSHARAQPKNDKQNKTLSLSLCVCVCVFWSNWNKSRPVIFNFSVSPIFFCVCSSADDGTENKKKKPSSEHNNHTGNYISTCTFIITYTHQEPSGVPIGGGGGGGIYNIYTRNYLFNLIFFFTCFSLFFEEERISRHTHTHTNE